MQIERIKIAGAEVYVIFMGYKYFFYSDAYGLIGIARRLGYSDDVLHTFELSAGNGYTVGSRFNRGTIIAKIKQYINKNESKHIEAENTFIDNDATLNHWLSINEVEYK